MVAVGVLLAFTRPTVLAIVGGAVATGVARRLRLAVGVVGVTLGHRAGDELAVLSLPAFRIRGAGARWLGLSPRACGEKDTAL